MTVVAETNWSWVDDLPDDIRITEIMGFDLVSRRSKFCGKNAVRGEHGDRAIDRVIRVFTSAGVDGIGYCPLWEDQMIELLGTDPFDLFRNPNGKAAKLLGSHTMAFWDLAGKFLKKPAYELMGGCGTERVPVYDGSIYFTDLLEQYASDFMARFREEIDQGLEIGHRGFKIKIGRGFRWMSPEEGYERDLAVVRAIREYAGPDVMIGVDANNGYDEKRTRAMLCDLSDVNITFVEEPFKEDVRKCLELKRFIADNGWTIYLADGEGSRKPDDLAEFAESKALDIFQGDMRRYGIEGVLAESEMTARNGLLIAPHNWGSLLGFIMQLHVGRAVPNFFAAEHDPLSNDILDTDGYKIEDGYSTVSDAPGFGLHISDSNFDDIELNFDVGAI